MLRVALKRAWSPARCVSLLIRLVFSPVSLQLTSEVSSPGTASSSLPLVKVREGAVAEVGVVIVDFGTGSRMSTRCDYWDTCDCVLQVL